MFEKYCVTPKNGSILVVLIVARISGCQSQNEVSLEDQVDTCKEIASNIYDGEIEFRVISTKGKGEDLERPELEQIAQALKEDVDVLIQEDVSRLLRGVDAVKIWGMAVDAEIRCLAVLNDLDTTNKQWESKLIDACRKSIEHQELTSMRIKSKCMMRFKRDGACPARLIAGYEDPPGAKTYFDRKRIDKWTPIIQEGLDVLEEHLKGGPTAKLFNRAGFPVGTYAKNTRWNGRMVRQFFKNRMLGGYPGRGHNESVKNHRSGQRKSRPSKKDPIYIHCPNLAHVDIEQLDRVNKLIANRNAKFGSPGAKRRRLRKDSTFPSQFAICYYCGAHFVCGANGITKNMQCSAVRNGRQHCWHSVGFSGPKLVEACVRQILCFLDSLPGFNDQFSDLVRTINAERSAREVAQLKDIATRQLELDRLNENFTAAIAKFGAKDRLQQELDHIKLREAELRNERKRLQYSSSKNVHLPDSLDLIRDRFVQKLSEVNQSDSDFRGVMEEIVESIHLYSVQILGAANLYPRAQVKFNLAKSISPHLLSPELEAILSKMVMFDLFDPPTYVRIRPDVVRLTSEKVKQRDIAAELATHQATVQRALQLQRLMDKANVNSPFVFVAEPPATGKLKRHKHEEYRFQPVDGYVPPEIV